MLTKSGCEHILLFHDLDRNHEKELRLILSSKVNENEYPNSIIIVPVEELEAWLLSDGNAIKTVFKLNKIPKQIYNCETVNSPKEHLRDMVWKLGKKRYLNTTHNQKIAKHSSITNFMRCESYKPLDKYIRENICA